MTFFHHKDLGNHLLQLCPKVVKHPAYINILVILVERQLLNLEELFFMLYNPTKLDGVCQEERHCLR